MELELIQMDKDEAMIAYEAYQASVKKNHNEIDLALTRGYKALCKGKKVINLNSVLRKAGLNEDGLPNLACIRADATYCYLYNYRRIVRFAMSINHLHHWKRQAVDVPKSVFPDLAISSWTSPKAIVPIVPAHLRPNTHLRNYHILWEAEWESVPVDPVLLKHIHGALYSVEAQWDLTPLERAVMEEYLV